MHLSVTCPRCQSKYQLDRGHARQADALSERDLPGGLRGAGRQRSGAAVEALVKPGPPAADVPDDFPGDEEPALAPQPVEPTPVRRPEAPPPKTVEAKKPEPVKRKPVPKPIEPEPLDFPDDFPGDDEALAPASAPAIATEAWQPQSLEAPPARDAGNSPAPVSSDSIRAGVPPMHPAPDAIRAGRPPARAAPAGRCWTILAMVLVLAGVAAGGWWRIQSEHRDQRGRAISRGPETV